MVIKAYYFQVSTTTSRSQHPCTAAAERNEAPDDVSSTRKEGLFPCFLTLPSDLGDTHHSSLFAN